MCLNEELLERTEEFLELLANEDEDVNLDFSVDSLRTFLERDVDGWASHSEDKLAIAVQERLEEIWNLISPEEKCDNYLLEEHYEDIMGDLEEIAHFDSEYENSKEQNWDDDEENEEDDDQSEEYFEDSDDDCEEDSWD